MSKIYNLLNEIDLFITNCIARALISKVQDLYGKELIKVTRHFTVLYLQLYGMIYAVIKKIVRGKFSKIEST